MMTKSIICSIPSIIFLMISVNAHKETKAVCFFNFTKRPIVDDVKRFNLAISNLWIAAACIMELVCIFTLFCIPDSSVFVFMTFAEIVLILGVVASYFKIQKKYKKQINRNLWRNKHDKEYCDFYFFKRDIPTYLVCNKQNKKH